MNNDLVRDRNDKTFGQDWAENEAQRMSMEQMIKFIYTPNSSYLGPAIQERMMNELQILKKLEETKEDIQYLLSCVEVHAEKFPVPKHITQRIKKIRKALI